MNCIVLPVSSGATDDTWITHVWYCEDQELARVRLPVRSSNWRTWSSKQILPQWKGAWRVEVLVENGEAILIVPFSIFSGMKIETKEGPKISPSFVRFGLRRKAIFSWLPVLEQAFRQGHVQWPSSCVAQNRLWQQEAGCGVSQIFWRYSAGVMPCTCAGGDPVWSSLCRRSCNRLYPCRKPFSLKSLVVAPALPVGQPLHLTPWALSVLWISASSATRSSFVIVVVDACAETISTAISRSFDIIVFSICCELKRIFYNLLRYHHIKSRKKML